MHFVTFTEKIKEEHLPWKNQNPYLENACKHFEYAFGKFFPVTDPTKNTDVDFVKRLGGLEREQLWKFYWKLYYLFYRQLVRVSLKIVQICLCYLI